MYGIYICFFGKCREIYHTWILWVCCFVVFCVCLKKFDDVWEETPPIFLGLGTRFSVGFCSNDHDWSTYPPPTHPPQKQGFNKALLRETNGQQTLNKALFFGGGRLGGVG